MNKINVIRKAPGKAPERIEIENALDALQWKLDHARTVCVR